MDEVLFFCRLIFATFGGATGGGVQPLPQQARQQRQGEVLGRVVVATQAVTAAQVAAGDGEQTQVIEHGYLRGAG